MTKITDLKFLKAYEMASKTTIKFPPDTMLHFYAYYKRATQKNEIYSAANTADVQSGFKANALVQIENLSPLEARNKYIEMVEKHIGEI